MKKFFYRCSTIFIAIWLMSACTTATIHVSQSCVVGRQSPFIVGPIANNSDTPLAHKQVESMLLGLLHSKGFTHVNMFPRQGKCDSLLYCPDSIMSKDALIRWGRQHHAAYILTGAVNEWRYKVGLDGEPVAGVSLILLNVATGQTVWTGVGSIIGSTRLGLDVVAQDMLVKILSSILIHG